MNKTFFVLFLSILLGLGNTFAAREDRVSKLMEESQGRQLLIYKFSIKQEIAPPSVRNTQRAFDMADSLNADIILLHLNTYGGMVDAADSIRTRIMQSKIPVVVFIDNNAASAGALISIAADRIYMRPGGNIGAATVVDQSGEVVPDKYQSYMRSMMRSTAEAKGRNPEIAQAMVDPSFAIEGVIEEGKVLTFTASEAMRWGFCEGMAENISEVIQLMGVEDYKLVEQKLTATDKMINFLIHPVVSGILIMLILGGIYFELQTPGVGFPILLAITAALMYFAPLYLEGLASHWEVALFVIGLILLAVEVFAIPGFGVAGVLGIVFMISGLALAMVGNQGPDFSGVPAREVLTAFFIVIISFFISLSASLYLGAKLFTSKTLGSRLALNTVQDTQAGYSSASAQIKAMVGQTGTAYTMLRPSGKIEIGEEIYDATALNGYIEKGETVKVVKYETSQVFVVKA